MKIKKKQRGLILFGLCLLDFYFYKGRAQSSADRCKVFFTQWKHETENSQWGLPDMRMPEWAVR